MSLEYQNGIFVRGATRGDGVTGEDVTDNLRTIEEIPKVLKDAPPELVVRGEVYMRRSVFDAINAQRELDGQPLLANPKLMLFGAAAQFGIFFALFGALGLAAIFGDDFFGCNAISAAASIGIIGGADGPTAIWLTSRLAPNLLGAIAVAAYSYMALVPIIQPPIMKALTTKAERAIKMPQLREVKKIEKICFPLIVLLLCAFLLPSAVPLIGAMMLGNLAKEVGPSVSRASRTRCPTRSSTS